MPKLTPEQTLRVNFGTSSEAPRYVDFDDGEVGFRVEILVRGRIRQEQRGRTYA